MTTVPTELLRTFVAVVDFRSFTKAAQSLGVTQPAVSAQIKRLQVLLGGDLFDKRAPGVKLTEKGEHIVNYARRLLAINDRILYLAAPRAPEPVLRIGITGDFAGTTLPATFAAFRARYPSLRFHIRGDSSDTVLRNLRQGDLDLAVAFTMAGPAMDARHQWHEETVWVRGAAANFGPSEPVPLVTFGEECVLHRLATTTLSHAGLNHETVFSAFSLAALLAAVGAGLGVTLLPLRCVPVELRSQGSESLPPVPELWGGIYLRDGIDCEVLEALADAMNEALRPRPEAVAARPEVAWPAIAAGGRS